MLKNTNKNRKSSREKHLNANKFENPQGYVAPILTLTRETIIENIERNLPEFVKAVQIAEKEAMVCMHQDGFASGLDINELVLLGMAVKYAGFKNRQILFIGTHRETYKGDK